MGQDTDQILVAGGGGGVFVAPVGTAFPSTPISPLSGSWVDLGLINEDGVAFTDAKTMEDYPVWQLFYPARKTITGRDAMFKFTLAQWNGDTVVFAFGGADIAVVTGVGGPYYRITPPEPGAIDDRTMLVRWADGDRNYQLGFSRGLVSENVETNLNRTKPAELPITFALIGQDGVKPWEALTDDPAFA